jgi:RAT1-interacting protein
MDQEIACFSYDDNHHYRPDESGIRYYYPPRIGADLSSGFDSFKKLDDSADDHLDSLLKTLMVKEQETRAKTDGDVITWRGMMTKVGNFPASPVEGGRMSSSDHY